MIQATLAIVDFILILIQAGLWVAGWAAAFLLVGGILVVGAFVLVRGLLRRRRRRKN